MVVETSNLSNRTKARLRRLHKQIPLGTEFERLKTIDLPFYPDIDIDPKRKGRVKVQCKCGTEFIVRTNSLLGGNTKSCGCLHEKPKGMMSPRWKGLNYPRHPWKFKEILVARQLGRCAWPPCQKSLDSTIHVDHAHNCYHKHMACERCIRGAVHALCNTVDIRACDKALELGAIFPVEIQTYLEGRPLI